MKYTPPWYSTYEKNNYGELFYALMRIYRPKNVVELGTKAGYSAYHIARGLKDNGRGTLDCYDLWETYPFRSVPKSVAEKNLKKYKRIVQLTLRNAIGIEKEYTSVDILHVDISNDGEKLEAIIPKWIDKVRQLIIIEGGSRERDTLDWMITYKKKSIKNWLKAFSRRRKDIQYITFAPWLSVTIIRKVL